MIVVVVAVIVVVVAVIVVVVLLSGLNSFGFLLITCGHCGFA